MRLLALDFDGVIADSAPESFVVALRTFVAMRPDSPHRDHPVLESDLAGLQSLIGVDALYRRFLDLMPLGNRAEDYGVILTALEVGAPITDQRTYDAFRNTLDADWLRSFHRRFYPVRAELAQRDPEGWHGLIGPYPVLLEIVRRRRADVILAVATAKDRGSVNELLRKYGVDDLFPEDRVLDKETGVEKSAHLIHLHRLCGIEYAEMTFIDDKVNHLDDVAPLGVRCGLAAWGYNGSREEKIAGARGYLICRLEALEQQLFASK